jgi:hypothetical protein
VGDTHAPNTEEKRARLAHGIARICETQVAVYAQLVASIIRPPDDDDDIVECELAFGVED